MLSETPYVFLLTVWPLSLSLATTHEISVDFSSSGYLDVSVPRVPLIYLCIQYTIHDSSSWGFPHSDTHGSVLIYSSPWLFAVNRVLRRLLMPRHSPYALCNLNLLFSFAWYSQYLFTDLVACFLPPFGGKIAVFLTFFLERPIL